MPIRLLRQISGSKWTIYHVEEDGKNHVEEFLEDLRLNRLNLYLRLIKSVDRMANHGPHPSGEKFKPEKNGIFAIKEGQARLYGFYAGKKKFALTNGDLKKRNKADPKVLRKALELKLLYET